MTDPVNRIIVNDLCQSMLCAIEIAGGALLDEGHSMPEVQAAIHQAADLMPELWEDLQTEE